MAPRAITVWLLTTTTAKPAARNRLITCGASEYNCSNSNPDGTDYPIPGNDDARRSIDLYCNLLKETIENANKSIPKVSEEKMVEKKDDKKSEIKKNNLKTEEEKSENKSQKTLN